MCEVCTVCVTEDINMCFCNCEPHTDTGHLSAPKSEKIKNKKTNKTDEQNRFYALGSIASAIVDDCSDPNSRGLNYCF